MYGRMIVCKLLRAVTPSFALLSMCCHSEQDWRKARPAGPDPIPSRSTPTPLCTMQAHSSWAMGYRTLASVEKSVWHDFPRHSAYFQVTKPHPLMPLSEVVEKCMVEVREHKMLCLPKSPAYQGRWGRVRSRTQPERVKSGKVRWAWLEKGCCWRCGTSRRSLAEHSPRSWLISESTAVPGTWNDYETCVLSIKLCNRLLSWNLAVWKPKPRKAEKDFQTRAVSLRAVCRYSWVCERGHKLCQQFKILASGRFSRKNALCRNLSWSFYRQGWLARPFGDRSKFC